MSEAADANGKAPQGWSWTALAKQDGVADRINSDIYGEILPDGMALLFLSLPTHLRLDQDSVVYDIGSGYGKFSIWVGTVAKHKSIGIENNTSRAKYAAEALKDCFAKGLLDEEDKARIDLREGDATIEGSFEDATHVYCGNVGFEEELMIAILERAVADCKKLKIFCTTTSLHDGERAIDTEAYKRLGLKFHGTTKCPTTWDQTGDQTKLHIYVTKFADKMEGEVEIDKLRLKLVDAERFSKIVTDVYEPIMSSIPGDSI
jgi:SAM-dependent methyltransferase